MKTLIFSIIITISVSLLIVSCKKDPPANNIVIPPIDSVPPTDTFPRNLEFEVLKKGGKLGRLFDNPNRTVYVVNNDSAWWFIRSEINIPDTTANVNFDSSTVLVVLDYVKPSGPSPVNILEITEYKDSVIIKIESESVCCGMFQSPTHPYEIVKVAKIQAKPIAIIEE